MTEKFHKTIATSLVILAFVGTAFALNYARSMLIPFVLAIFLTYIFSPIVDVLQAYLKAPRWLALVAALVAGLSLVLLLLVLISVNLRDLINSADIYRDRVLSLANDSIQFVRGFGIQLDEQALLRGLRQLPIFGAVKGIAGTLVNFVSTAALVTIFLMFMLTGKKNAAASKGIYAEIDRKIRKYLVTKVTTSSATGVLTGLILALFGVELAFMFGVLSFLLNFIPTIGSIIAVVLPVPIVLLQFDSYVGMAFAVLLPGVVQFAIGNIIEPRMMGQSLDLHPAAILLALMFWGLLWGTVGMILAVPIMAIIKIVLERIDGARPLSEILAGRLPS